MEADQRLAGVAELGQHPRRAGHPAGGVQHDIAGPGDGDHVLDRAARLRPVAFEDVQQARGVVRETDGVRLVRRLGERDPFRFVRDGLREPPEVDEARDHVVPAHDRHRREESEALVPAVRGQRREARVGKVDDTLVLAVQVVHLLEARHRRDAQLQVTERARPRERRRPGGERGIQLAQRREDVRLERADTRAAAIVLQSIGEGLRLLQAVQPLPDFAPRRRTAPSSSTLSSLACSAGVRSPISSRKSVLWCASWKSPGFACRASVKAPRS